MICQYKCDFFQSLFSYQIYLLFTRHVDIPESCLRYMGAMVDDVIILDPEVNILKSSIF